jgi:hypothetical protein
MSKQAKSTARTKGNGVDEGKMQRDEKMVTDFDFTTEF